MATASHSQDSSYASRPTSTAKTTTAAGSIIAKHVTQSLSDRVKASIADTAGGRLATTINDSSNASLGAEKLDFEGNSLSAGGDEISRFINKKPPED